MFSVEKSKLKQNKKARKPNIIFNKKKTNWSLDDQSSTQPQMGALESNYAA